MSTLDGVILIVFTASVVVGFWRGVIVQAGSFGALICGVLLCRVAGPWFTLKIAGADGVDYLDRVLAYVILFIVGYGCVWLLSRLVKKITHALSLGIVDRLLGAAFSLFQWMLGLSLLLNFWLVLKPETNFRAMSGLANGHAIDTVLNLAPWVLGFMQ